MASHGTNPIVVWIPGLMHTEKHYEPIVQLLKERNIPSVVIVMPNYGSGAATAEPYDDVKVIRSTVSSFADSGHDVILIAHSYGGLPLLQAVRGLDKATREKNGQANGITHAVWMCAFLFPHGAVPREVNKGVLAPFVDWDGGAVYTPKREIAMKLFYQDLPEAEQRYYANELVPSAFNTSTTRVLDPCYDVDVKKTYIFATEDAALPLSRQKHMVETFTDETWTIESLPAGHSPFLSQKEGLVEIIERMC